MKNTVTPPASIYSRRLQSSLSSIEESLNSSSSSEDNSTEKEPPVLTRLEPLAPPPPGIHASCLNHHHLFSPNRLTHKQLQQKLHQFVREQFQHSMHRKNILNIESAWRQYNTIPVATPFIRNCMQPLQITPKQKNEFLQQIEHEHPHINHQQRTFIRNAFECNNRYPGHAFLFGASIDLTRLIETRKGQLFPEYSERPGCRIKI